MLARGLYFVVSQSFKYTLLKEYERGFNSRALVYSALL